MYTIQKLAKEIKSATEWLIKQQEGCVTIKLDDVLAVCVGWSNGYCIDDKDSAIRAIDDPSWGITAGIKAWNSDSLRTDFDWINSPYYDISGDVWDTECSISKDVDYCELSTYFLNEYEALKKLTINYDGRIINSEEE